MNADGLEQSDSTASSGKGFSGRAKSVLLLGAIVALITAVAWFARYETHGKYMESTSDAELRADAVTVSPRTAGYVDQVLVSDNEDVVAGQPLVRIDARDYRAQAAQAEAQVAIAKAQAANAESSILEQQANIAQAAAQLDAARTKARSDAAEVARYAPLAAAGAETRERLATLRTTAAQSSASVHVQEAALAAQRQRVETVRAQVAQARAQGRAAAAQVAAASVDVTAAIIRAPIGGRVGDRTVRFGQYAQTGTRFMTLVPLDRIYVVANFKETQLARMRVGQPATIKVDALDGLDLPGKIVSVAPGTGAQFSLLPPQNATGNFTKIVQRVPVRIAVEPSPAARRLLVPGLSVTVTVDTSSARHDLEHIRDQQRQFAEQAH